MSRNKVIAIKDEAKNKIMKGANFLADAVKLTLGPAGLNAISGLKNESSPRITNDGYTIAREISLTDPLEDLGVKVLREATSKTNDEAGDGTTTATILAQVITQEALKQLPGYKGLIGGKKTISQVTKAIKAETADVVEKLKTMATPIKTKKELVEVATVSVENEGLADLIGSTQFDIGEEGVILVEETAETTDSIERVKGVRIDNGYATSALITNAEKQSLELKNVQVILTNQVIDRIGPLVKILDVLLKNNLRDVVIMARGFSENAIKECIKNHEQQFRLYPVNAPYVNQKEIMLDLEAVLGGTYYDREERDLEEMLLSDVGFAEKIRVNHWDAIFTGKADKAADERVVERVKELKLERKGEKSQFAQKQLDARISQLTNGFAVLKVGALSDTERRYKKDKADDAVNAVRAALQEGVVPGAGMALKTIGEALPDTTIIKKALLAPYAQIMENAGETFEVPAWVKDPVKVVRVALEKAASVATILATTAIAIDHEREKPRYVQEAPQPSGEGVE